MADTSVFSKPFDGSLLPFVSAIRVTLVGTEPFFGPGVASLLTQIDRCGSVAGACAQMGLSYSKGRTLLRRLEREAGFSVVTRTQGGAGGGSAQLTDRGKALLCAYSQYQRDIQNYAQARFARVFAPVQKEESL